MKTFKITSTSNLFREEKRLKMVLLCIVVGVGLPILVILITPLSVPERHQRILDSQLSTSLRGAAVRPILIHNITRVDINENTTIQEAERLLHRSLSDIEVSCPVSERVGSVQDGGWNVCTHPSYLLHSPCLVYSFGIDYDWTFDDDIVALNNCTVHSFDPSMGVEDHKRGTSIYFHNVGLGGNNTDPSPQLHPSTFPTPTLVSKPQNKIRRPPPSEWKLRTLDTLVGTIQDNNDTVIIDYLKMDIEGAEWNSLERMPSVLARTKQLGIEIHLVNYGSGDSLPSYLRWYRILSGLHALGFRKWYSHNNPSSFYKSNYKENWNLNISRAVEMIYINMKYV